MNEMRISNIQLNDITVDSEQNFLIIDDDQDINQLLVEYLELMGFNGKFLTATSILQAKKHLKYEKINFILSDWNLPDGEGIAFLKAIRKSPKFRDIPFVMVTGQDDIDSMIKSQKIGSSEYLTKPFDLEAFKDKLVHGWKTHVIPNQEKVHLLNQRINELESDLEILRIENYELKKKLEN